MRCHAGLRLQQRGTTLIEVMVSVILLSIGLLGIVGLQARAMQTTVDSENRANAALLANELATAMWVSHDNTNNSSVSAAFTNWQAVTSRALPSGAYTIGTPDGNGAVRIAITWTAPGQQVAANTVQNQFFTTVAIP